MDKYQETKTKLMPILRTTSNTFTFLSAFPDNAHAKKQLEKEGKAMDKYQEKKTKLNNIEADIAKINEEFNLHVEAQVRAMEDEKARQHRNVANRRARALARRNKRTASASQIKKGDNGGNGALRLITTELQDTLTKAKQRAMSGKNVEEQLQALLADVAQTVAHQQATGAAPPQTIARPRLNLTAPMNVKSNKLALAEARNQLKDRLGEQKVSRDSAVVLMQARGNLQAPSLKK